MPQVKVGLRHLYNARSCSVKEGGQIQILYDLGDGLTADVLIGGKPKWGITAANDSPKYLDMVPTEPQFLGIFSINQDVEKSPYKGKCLTEITAWQSVEVSENIYSPYQAKAPESHVPVMKLAEELKPTLRKAALMAASMLGLRCHPQLILHLISEESLALRGEELGARSCPTPWMEWLEPVVGSSGHGVRSFTLVAEDPKLTRIRQTALPWLVSAWQSHDLVVQFTALFIALEVCLGGVKGTLPDQFKEATDKMRKSINSLDAPARDDMLAQLDSLCSRTPPTLMSRFKKLAEQAKLEGWEADVKAFEEFNRKRNALIHRGDSDVELLVKFRKEAEEGLPPPDVTDEEVRTLRDLVERYVCYRVFGDAEVYRSRWRKGPGT